MAKVYIDEIEKCVKLVYSMSSTLNDKTTKKDVQFFVDFADHNLIQAHTKSFQFLVDDTSFYPSYLMNYTRINLLQHLYHTRGNIICDFVNGDEFDLRRANVRVFHKKHAELEQNKDYEMVEYYPGHYKLLGPDAFNMKNPRWSVKHLPSGDKYLLMFCEPDSFVELCQEAYDRIQVFELKKNAGKPFSFYIHNDGKVSSGFRNLYMNQIIVNQPECEYEPAQIRHLDGNLLNHRLVNLVTSTPEVKTIIKKTSVLLQHKQNPLPNLPVVQLIEGTKRKRQCIARELPEGLQQEMMRKYVVYYRECYHKEKGLYREFFKVEGHPKFNGSKVWTTSKSNKISWQDKLAHANKVVDDLVRDVYPNTEATEKLPPYYRIEEKMGKYQLIYDKRNDVSGIRHNMRMILPAEFNLDMEIENFKAKLAAKYPPIVDEIKN